MDDPILTRWQQFSEAGRLFFAQGDDARAEEAYRAAAAEAERLGTDDARHASSLVSVAQVKYRQRAYAEAEDLLRRSLAMQERVPNGAAVAPTLSSLAAVCAARGDFTGAEKLLRRVLAIYERAADGHPQLGATLNALARVYFKLGDHTAAEPLLLRLLAIKQALGRTHPEVAAVLTSLATLREAVGRHAEAEQFWRQALAIRESGERPSAAAISALRAKLADSVAAQGRHAEATMLRGDAAVPAGATSDDVATAPAESRTATPHTARPRATTPHEAAMADGASLFSAAAALAFGRYERASAPVDSPAPPAHSSVSTAKPHFAPTPAPATRIDARPIDATPGHPAPIAAMPIALAPLAPPLNPVLATARRAPDAVAPRAAPKAAATRKVRRAPAWYRSRALRGVAACAAVGVLVAKLAGGIERDAAPVAVTAEQFPPIPDPSTSTNLSAGSVSVAEGDAWLRAQKLAAKRPIAPEGTSSTPEEQEADVGRRGREVPQVAAIPALKVKAIDAVTRAIDDSARKRDASLGALHQASFKNF